jgi:hypothetical protein
MSVTVVNGQFCFSACDVAKAQANDDPPKRPGELATDPSADTKKKADDPAVTFDKALKDLIAAKDITAPDPAKAPKHKLDIHV